MAKVVPSPPYLFRYNHGFNNKKYLRKQSSDSIQHIMRIFILINFIYFGFLTASYLYDIFFNKAFLYGRFVFTSCFKKCSACDDLKSVKQEIPETDVSFLLPPRPGTLYSTKNSPFLKEDSDANHLNKTGVSTEIPDSEELLVRNCDLHQRNSLISKTNQTQQVSLKTSITQTTLSSRHFDLLPDFIKNILYRGRESELITNESEADPEINCCETQPERTEFKPGGTDISGFCEEMD